MSIAFRLAALAVLALSLVSQAVVAQTLRWSALTPTGVTSGIPGGATRFAAADASGNLFVAAKRQDAANSCFVTLKYTSDGALAWTKEVCSAYPGSAAMAVAVDGAGNAYVTGTVGVCCQVDFDRPAEIRTIKYRGSDGALLWDRGWTAGGVSRNAGYAVVVDASGNPYVVGTSYNGVRERLKAMKLNAPTGDTIWETLYDGEGNYTVVGAGLAPNGDLLVGTTMRGVSFTRPEIFDFSGTGGFAIWHYSAGLDEQLTAFTVDSTGAAIAALYVVNPTTLVDNIRIRKHATMGSVAWQRDYGSAGNDNAFGVAADAGGNIAVAADLGGIYDLLRYTRDGQLIFDSNYSTDGLRARGIGVAFDAEGNILSTGTENTSAGEFMRVAKQDGTTGTVRWQARVGAGGSTHTGGILAIPAGATAYAVGLEAPLGGNTQIRIANFANAPSSTGVNVHGLWWNPAQSGWGINLSQQGDKLFATWYGYDTDGQGLWLVMSNGTPSGTNAWSGDVHRTTGPSFSTFNSSRANQVSYALVGTATLTFGDSDHGTLTMTVNGVARSFPISRFQFAAMPACALGATPGSAPNYTDIWWRPGEPGWGISLAHQGDILFALWYTYAPDSRAMWLVASRLERVSDRAYSGVLHRTTGTPFGSSNWQDTQYQPMGSVTLEFADANNAVMTYTVNGVNQAKTITRYVYASPMTVCR